LPRSKKGKVKHPGTQISGLSSTLATGLARVSRQGGGENGFCKREGAALRQGLKKEKPRTLYLKKKTRCGGGLRNTRDRAFFREESVTKKRAKKVGRGPAHSLCKK